MFDNDRLVYLKILKVTTYSVSNLVATHPIYECFKLLVILSFYLYSNFKVSFY